MARTTKKPAAPAKTKPAPAKKPAAPAKKKPAPAKKPVAPAKKKPASAKKPAGPAKRSAVAAKQATASPARPSARERGLTVDAYVAKLSPPQQAVVGELRALIRIAAPTVREGIKWGQPVYEANHPMMYLRGSKHHVTFGFWRGVELAARGFTDLDGDGGRMRHLKLAGAADLDRARIAALIADALALDATLGDPTRR